jgi:hypothetical protein
MNRLARATQSTVTEMVAHLELPSAVAHSANYKAEGKPAAAEKVEFDALLDASEITPEQRNDIYTATE